MNIAANLTQIRAEISAVTLAAGRGEDMVQLIAVSKFHPVSAIAEALAAGQTIFGENRVQEAGEKFSTLRTSHPQLELHLIGALQTNKALEAVRLFDVIQTLDRPKLAAALAAAIQKTGKSPRLYIQINTGDEAQKAGISEADFPNLLQLCQSDYNLTISGLMCIPPQTEPPEPHFHRLKQLADRYNFLHLSMGMSADYQAAIACGATEIRVGTAIFGNRPTTATAPRS